MNTSKRHHQLRSIEDKNISTSTSAFIETPLTSISQTIENRLNNLNHQQIDWQEQINGFHHKKSRFIQEYFDNSIRAKNKQTDVNRTKTILNQTQNDNEDDWVLFNLKRITIE
jgi:transposase